MKHLRVGVIGLGGRGCGLLSEAILPQEEVTVTAVCDVYDDRLHKAAEMVVSRGGEEPKLFTDYRKLLTSGLVDVVIIASPWQYHIPMAIDAMNAHVPVGVEVGGAMSVEDCFALVDTWEKTKTPFTMLENCCYDRTETALLAMVKAGVFGKVVAVDGGYMHDLRNEVSFGKENRHYRLEHYLSRNAENYPTHELGPLARLLDIGGENRFVSLVSVASSAEGLHAYVNEKKKDDEELCNAKFAQGDVVTTVITCSKGQTVTLRLDTTLPRPYCRGITVHGTKAMYEEDNNMLFIDGVHGDHEFDAHGLWDNFKEYEPKYRNADWTAVANGFVAAGHGGMDFFMMRDFFNAVREGREPYTSVYDAAEWMAVTPLSAASIAAGGTSVPFPRFRPGERSETK